MMPLFLGFLAFGGMAFSDFWSALRKRKGGRLLFSGCCLLLAVATLLLILQQDFSSLLVEKWRFLFLFPAILCLLLLIYTIFFALPANGSSPFPPDSSADAMIPLVQTGVYALCRHPGVLWLSGFYLSLWGFCGGFRTGIAAIWFSVLDLLYVGWQDRFVFPKTIRSYASYQLSTPFLIPSRSSLLCCFRDYFPVRKK
ncbi:MAG: hypothetical protein ACOX6P_07925 [Candidatus Merdivicinus sp.]|jgi:protein-S-isoprenylcysteine O-methyltransferase Ste14